ncbi:MAG TPA: hypothetical protein VHX87_07105 [Galbitalea sp.]|jgi:uncharacterized membrane protein|nr:hypothetical protein [Galbitalea sp.]
MNNQTRITRAARTAPDQSIRARQRINAAIAEPGVELIDTATARIIAASVHGGYGTALCTFAATGVLKEKAALAELGAVPSTELPQTWREAFTDFVNEASVDHHD